MGSGGGGGGGGSSTTQRLVVEEPEPGQVSQDQEEKEREENGSISVSPSDLQQQLQEKKKDVVYPVCWFEDEASGVPLRWHFFAGILFDACSSTATAAWQQQQQNHHHISSTAGESPNHPPPNSGEAGEVVFLPWKIRLHFTSYPSTQLLELGGGAGGGGGDGVLTVVERSFKNSLKQALFLQHGNSKIAMNMTKQAHGQLWESILTTKYSIYRQVNAEYLQPMPKQQPPNNSNNNNTTTGSSSSSSSTVQLIPIRILVDSKPALQKKCSAEQQGETLTLGGLLCQWVPEYFGQLVPVTTSTSSTSTSERIVPDRDEAAAVASGESNEEVGANDASHADDNSTVILPRDGTSISWHVGGIVPPLTTLVMDLWRAMSHPDHFLYIVVTTTSKR
jgi:hypothetical protein